MSTSHVRGSKALSSAGSHAGTGQLAAASGSSHTCSIVLMTRRAPHQNAVTCTVRSTVPVKSQPGAAGTMAPAHPQIPFNAELCSACLPGVPRATVQEAFLLLLQLLLN